MKKAYILFIILISLSCEKEITTEENSVSQLSLSSEKNIEIKGSRILENDLGALGIYLTDELLLTKQTDSDTIFKVYSLPNLDYMGFLGLKGNGPNEWTAPRYSDDYVVDDGETYLWMHDARKLSFRKVDIIKSLNQPTAVVKEEIYIHPKHGLSQFLFHINDSIVIGNTGYESLEKARLKKLNLTRDIIVAENKTFPTMESGEKLRPSSAYALFFDRLKFSKERNIFVSAMQKFDRIDLFSVDLTHLKTIYFGEEAIKFDIDEYQSKPVYQYYKDLALTSEYIYALFCKVELKENMESLPSQVRVFNWEGSLVRVIQLPDDLMSIAVDEKTQMMYGVDFNNEKILKYNIPVDQF